MKQASTIKTGHLEQDYIQASQNANCKEAVPRNSLFVVTAELGTPFTGFEAATVETEVTVEIVVDVDAEADVEVETVVVLAAATVVVDGALSLLLPVLVLGPSVAIPVAGSSRYVMLTWALPLVRNRRLRRSSSSTLLWPRPKVRKGTMKFL
jgi:hypothetical protein